jgi:hypothetical protein
LKLPIPKAALYIVAVPNLGAHGDPCFFAMDRDEGEQARIVNVIPRRMNDAGIETAAPALAALRSGASVTHESSNGFPATNPMLSNTRKQSQIFDSVPLAILWLCPVVPACRGRIWQRGLLNLENETNVIDWNGGAELLPEELSSFIVTESSIDVVSDDDLNLAPLSVSKFLMRVAGRRNRDVG